MREVSRTHHAGGHRPYRLEHSTAAERMERTSLLLATEGEYGVVTALARELGTSRQFLYYYSAGTHADGAGAGPGPRSGRPTVDRRLVVDRTALERAVLVLSQVGHASVRGIQECLEEMWGVARSVGWIEGVLQEAAERGVAIAGVVADGAEGLRAGARGGVAGAAAGPRAHLARPGANRAGA